MSIRTLNDRIALGQQVLTARQTGTRTADIAPILGLPLRTAQRYALLAETQTIVTVPAPVAPTTPTAVSTDPSKVMIFVFGSNPAGRHGGGASKVALDQHGAIWGQGEGLQGQSYAIPTYHVTMDALKKAVETFIEFAKETMTDNPDWTFQVTRVGCGSARFADGDVAPLFVDAPRNCLFDSNWHPWLGDNHRYWGSF